MLCKYFTQLKESKGYHPPKRKKYKENVLRLILSLQLCSAKYRLARTFRYRKPRDLGEEAKPMTTDDVPSATIPTCSPSTVSK